MAAAHVVIRALLYQVGAEVNIDAGIPTVIEGNIKINTELNLASTQGKTDTTVDTFKVSHEIKIPPKSKVEAIVTITGLSRTWSRPAVFVGNFRPF